jgi:hypothetical protein
LHRRYRHLVGHGKRLPVAVAANRARTGGVHLGRHDATREPRLRRVTIMTEARRGRRSRRTPKVMTPRFPSGGGHGAMRARLESPRASLTMRRPVSGSGRLAPLDGGSSRRSGVMRLRSSEQPAHISLIRRRSRFIVSRAPASSGNPPCRAETCSGITIDPDIEGAITNRLTAGPSMSARTPSHGAFSASQPARWTARHTVDSHAEPPTME